MRTRSTAWLGATRGGTHDSRFTPVGCRCRDVAALELWVLAIGVTVLALLVLRGVSLIERVLRR